MSSAPAATGNDAFFCAAASRRSAEHVYATASTFRALFLLEYDRPWGFSAFGEADIDPAAKSHLEQTLSRVRGSRLVLIKSKRRAGSGIRLFVVRNHEASPFVHRYELGDYADLVDLDLAGAVERRPAAEVFDPMLLVCTHGRHDKCCAKFGMPVYRRLCELLPADSVWECSHIGGDRFAANVIALPACAYYGAVEEADLEPLVRACQRGEVYPPKLRGRSCYHPILQAGEHFLRKHTGELALDAFRAVAADRNQSRTGYRLQFATRDGASGYAVTLKVMPSQHEDFLTCRQTQRRRANTYALLDIEELDGLSGQPTR